LAAHSTSSVPSPRAILQGSRLSQRTAIRPGKAGWLEGRKEQNCTDHATMQLPQMTAGRLAAREQNCTEHATKSEPVVTGAVNLLSPNTLPSTHLASACTRAPSIRHPALRSQFATPRREQAHRLHCCSGQHASTMAQALSSLPATESLLFFSWLATLNLRKIGHNGSHLKKAASQSLLCPPASARSIPSTCLRTGREGQGASLRQSR